MESIQLEDWGLIPYSEAYEKQKGLFDKAIQQKSDKKPVSQTVVLCEHPHVITIGKNGMFSNLLFPENILKEKKIELFHVDRGGDITYHGPGQLVGYPIFDLEALGIGLKEYIHKIEAAIIELLQQYGIQSERLDGATGVWIDTGKPGKTRKICAIGVRSSRFVTMHGFALNVQTDLDYFRYINPCGFVDKGVTSMEQELKSPVDFNKVKEEMYFIFKQYFKEN